MELRVIPEPVRFPRTALSAEMRLVCTEIELDMPPDFTAVIHK